MRFLHTGDWHLGRTIRGQSRQPEFEQALDEVCRIALDEKIDAMIIAGDTFDTFSPNAETERLFYETLGRLLREKIQIVMIAGNHDAADRMDARAGVLRMVGLHSVGSVTDTGEAPVVLLQSPDGENTVIAALPWVPERQAMAFETLVKGPDDAKLEYRGKLGRVIESAAAAFTPGSINILAAHVLVEGSEIGEEGGERKIHIGHNFAVNATSFPATAQYIALGHIHRPQQISAGAPAFYAGSLLQLDFGESGQKKSVRIVDVKPRRPADSREVVLTSGRALRTLRFPLEDLSKHAGKYGDDYLRVFVQIDHPVPSLYEQVREALPNALDVQAERTDAPAASAIAARTSGLAPHELLARFYRQRHNAEITPELLALFNQLHDSELTSAPA